MGKLRNFGGKVAEFAGKVTEFAAAPAEFRSGSHSKPKITYTCLKYMLDEWFLLRILQNWEKVQYSRPKFITLFSEHFGHAYDVISLNSMNDVTKNDRF